MNPVEIFGHAASRAFQDAELFCARMGYPYIMRDIGQDDLARDELLTRKKRAGFLPQIFIGLDQVGGLRDLIDMEPFNVQQLIGQ